MVSLPAGGIKSSGEFLGHAGHQSTKILELFDTSDTRKWGTRQSHPRFVETEADARDVVDVLDFNIREFSSANGKHLIDLIPEFFTMVLSMYR